MNPISHLLISWVAANTADLTIRDRALVTLAGVAPDIDGLGYFAEILTEQTASPLLWYSKYHHVLCHNLGFGLLLVVTAILFGIRRWMTAFLVLVVFHLHLLGDLVGSRGPDGYQWPIPYGAPFSDGWKLIWTGQWELNAWPNVLVTALLLAATIYIARRKGCSPLEMVSKRADSAFVSILRRKSCSPRDRDML
jgi:inner membrane protein